MIQYKLIFHAMPGKRKILNFKMEIRGNTSISTLYLATYDVLGETEFNYM